MTSIPPLKCNLVLWLGAVIGSTPEALVILVMTHRLTHRLSPSAPALQ